MNSKCYENSIPQNDPRFNREFAKMFANKQLQVDYDAIKELNRQEVSENRKKQVDAVTIKENGTLVIETLHLQIPTTARKVCNFCNPHLTRLISEADIETVWKFTCKIEEEDVEIYIKDSTAGDPEYLLRKFNAAGCEIYARNRRLQKEYLLKIWSAVRNTGKCEMMIPCNHGWWKDRDGSWKFADQSQKIWEEVKKCSK